MMLNKENTNNFYLESLPTLITLDLKNFLEMELPPRELILGPWLPKAGLCMIHAYRGIGKTHMSLGMAYAVVTGSEFLGWKAPIPRKVLFVDGEMPASTLQERLKLITKMSGDLSIPENLMIITPDLQPNGMPDIATEEGQLLLNRSISDDVDLIILDNMSCLASSIKENDAADWSLIQTWILRMRAQGKSVLMIHHSGKNGLQRGTSRKEDVLDTVITLQRPNDYDSSQGARFLVKFEKARGFYGDDAREFEAQLIDDGGKTNWQTRSLEESNYEKTYKLLNEGLKQKEIASELNLNKGTVSRYVQRATQEGKIEKKQNNKLHGCPTK
jgi:hypothetical protein